MAPAKTKTGRKAATTTAAAAGGSLPKGSLPKLFKQFKQKQDVKLLEKLKSAVQDAPCAASHLVMAKAYVLRVSASPALNHHLCGFSAANAH